MNALVSIIIPLYNKENYIEETLNSVLNQSYQNWECIIVDDHLTDSSRDKIKKFLSDIRFTLIINPKKGASAARNIGIKHSKGKYVQFLDADDLISKDKLKEQLELFQSSDKLSIATCRWGRFDKQYELYENLESYSNFEEIPPFLNSLISSKGYFPQNAYLFPQKILQISGPWNENLTLNDDGEFVMRVLTHCNKVLFAPNPVAWYRTATGNNLSSFKKSNAVEKAVYSWQLIEAHLKIRFKDETNEFIDWSKERFYMNIKNSHPELIQQNKNFFAEEIKKDKNNQKLFFRIKNKIKRILR